MSYALPNISHDLTGEVALITGASSGLGLRFAKVLARCGAKVALAARRRDRLEALAQQIRAEGGSALAVGMDASDAAQLVAAVDAAETRFGGVSILINNAGIPDAKRAHRMPLELIDQVININVRAPFILSCEVARRLIEREHGGRIVNISSASAFEYHGEGAALYSTTKAAVIRATETLAVEWARHGINVNAIAPGAFATDMLAGMMSRVGDLSATFARARIPDPAELDSTLLYLVGPASNAVTGAVIRVDDGQGGR